MNSKIAKRNQQLFVDKLSRAIERLAKKHHIGMWALQTGQQLEPVANGVTAVTYITIFSGDPPSDKDFAASEFDLSKTIQ